MLTSDLVAEARRMPVETEGELLNVIGRRLARRVRDLATVPAIGLHGIRHTYATLLRRHQDGERAPGARHRSAHPRALRARDTHDAIYCDGPLRSAPGPGILGDWQSFRYCVA